MSIRTKIIGGFLIVALLGVASGIAGFISAKIFSAKTDALYAYSVQSDSFTKILNVHHTWRNSMTESVITGTKFNGILDKWVDSKEEMSITDKKILELLARVDTPHNNIKDDAENVIQFLNVGDRNGAINEITSKILPQSNYVISNLLAVIERYNELIKEVRTDALHVENITKIISGIFIVTTIIGSLLLAFLVSSMVCKPILPLTAFMQNAGRTGDLTIGPENVRLINHFAHVHDELGHLSTAAATFVTHITGTSEVLEQIADGDLSSDINLLSDQDTMGLSLKKMADNLNAKFKEISTSAIQVSVGSNQVASGAQSLALGATHQAASIEELLSAISEMAEMTKANLAKAHQAAELTDIIKTSAEEGSHHMAEMTKSVQEINEASLSIGNVIKTIDNIAFQTNILALNAAVEASRAGQHGKGFAVVAEEVRNLAAKSTVAAKETELLIANSIEKAKLGARIADETSASLSKIVSGINKNNNLVLEIAKSSDAQSQNIIHINEGVEQVAQVVQQNSAAAEESAAASEEMSRQSTVLQELISQFKLKS